MPFWRLFHGPETFNGEQKAALAASITKFYTDVGIPAFYVDVAFVAVPKDSLFVGGKPAKNMVRIAIENIARKLGDVERAKVRLAVIDALLEPHVKDRGLDWEYHIVETPRELWKISGIPPPPTGSDAEKKWFLENKASPY